MSLNISERRPLLHRNSSRNSNNPRSPIQVQPATNSSGTHHILNRTRFASAAILLSLVFERIAFYGIAGNLVLFLNKDPFRWESYHAIDASLYFFGLCFVTSLVGGWLADSFMGRFKALLMSFAIYLAGYVLMPLMTRNIETTSGTDVPLNISLPAICRATNHDAGDDEDRDPFDERCAWLIYITLLLIAVGTGFVKANIAPFGSDQVAREGQQATLSFFNWFYWSINLGAFVGLSAITYVQQEKSFFYGYLASVCCLGVSALLFLAGRCCYRVRPPDGSVLTNIFRIIREAWRRKRQRRHETGSRRDDGRTINRVGDVDEADSAEARLSFLDYAKHRYGGIFHDGLVEDVKQLKRILAVFAVLLPYWLVYFQMQTTFLVQGLHMRLLMHVETDVRNGSIYYLDPFPLQNSSSTAEQPKLVAAWFALFDVIILIILLPFFDRIVYPWIERRTGSPVSVSRRIVLGMVFAVAAMAVAGVLEHFRLQTFWPYPDQPCKNASLNQMIGDTNYEAANLSILWQIPQYALIGLSEVFTSVAGLQFAVSVAPRSMKGIIMGLFYLFSGFGSLLGTGVIISLTAPNIWFHAKDFGNINCRLPCTPPENLVTQSCHLDYYFFLLGGIEVIGAFLFLLVAKACQVDQLHRQSRSPQRQEPGPELPGGPSDTPERVPPRNDPSQPRSVQLYRNEGEMLS